MDLQIFETRKAAERAVAAEIAALVAAHPEAVLGLASGDTPVGVYRELVRLHRDEGLDLSRVRTFNLDEYVELDPADPRSFHWAMRSGFFEPAGIPVQRTHFPDAWAQGKQLPLVALARRCEDFEREIREAGGINLQLLGVGRNGHIGFNEPGSAATSRTRLVELQPSTRDDAAAVFGGLDQVPAHALTMGVGTILEARAIRVLAFGNGKREVVARTMTSTADRRWPASFLHGHSNVRLYADRAAAPLKYALGRARRSSAR